PTGRIRASAASHRTSLQPGPAGAKTSTESSYERGQTDGNVSSNARRHALATSLAVNLESLDPYSKDVAEFLLSRHPEWTQYARCERQLGETYDYLLIDIPPDPNADLVGGLWMTSHNREVTVGLDYHHAHFDNDDQEVGMPECSYALRFVER